MMDLIALALLLILGYAFGRRAEARHYRSIRGREAHYSDLLLFAARVPPQPDRPRDSRLVTGSVVVALDFFKTFVAVLHGLLGGRLTSYEGLLDRARREAILRMKEDAARSGASCIFNVRIETVSIGSGGETRGGMVEVLAYGTALAD